MTVPVEIPHFDAGNLSLDFLNTRRNVRARNVDLLHEGTDVDNWLAAGGAPTGSRPALRRTATPRARILLTEALRLRGGIEALVTSFRTGQDLPSPSLYVVNRVLAASHDQPRVEITEGHAKLTTTQVGDSCLAPLVPIAMAAALLLTEADPTRVRRCASPDCGLWFLDSSKNGRRRWCSMARCGNRDKVARHHRRRQAEIGSEPGR